jgi:energy-coupling factor transporter ATP-binding protein EcfA2
VIRAINIKNLRGIREGKLEQLTELVVLVGPNSSGKSTVLDALMLGANPNPQDGLNRIMNRRPNFPQSSQWLIFRDLGRQTGPAEVTVNSDTPQSRMVTVLQQGNNPTGALQVSARYVTRLVERVQSAHSSPGVRPKEGAPLEDIPDINLVDPVNQRLPLAELYSQVAKQGLMRQAKSIVTELLPDVQDILILTQDNQPDVYLDYKNGSKPLATAGDGVRLLLRQSLELAAPAGGVILLEEPEVHLHPGAIRQSARAMLAAVARGIQVIITTHSLELIDSLLSESKTEDLDKLSFYRLQLKDGVLKSYRHSGTEASRARTQIEDDLR